MSVAAGEEGGKVAADADAGQSDAASRAKHGTMSVAVCEEDGLLAVNDHWEVEQRAHEAGAENLRVLPGIKREQDEREDLSNERGRR